VGQARQEFTAGVFVEQRVDEAVRSIDDVNSSFATFRRHSGATLSAIRPATHGGRPRRSLP